MESTGEVIGVGLHVEVAVAAEVEHDHLRNSFSLTALGLIDRRFSHRNKTLITVLRRRLKHENKR